MLLVLYHCHENRKGCHLKWQPYDLPREYTADVYLVGGARGEDFALNDIPHPDYV